MKKNTLGKLVVALLFAIIVLKMLFVPGPISIGTMVALGLGILVALGFSLQKFIKKIVKMKLGHESLFTRKPPELFRL